MANKTTLPQKTSLRFSGKYENVTPSKYFEKVPSRETDTDHMTWCCCRLAFPRHFKSEWKSKNIFWLIRSMKKKKWRAVIFFSSSSSMSWQQKNFWRPTFEGERRIMLEKYCFQSSKGAVLMYATTYWIIFGRSGVMESLQTLLCRT